MRNRVSSLGVIPLLNEINSEATKIGAVNTIHIQRPNKNDIITKGYNTDIYGFEKSLKPYINFAIKKALILGTGGAAKAVACVNGTSALHLALLLVGAERDTEVITQPLTFIATANAISYTRAKPLFIDVDKDTLGLSPEKLDKFLKNNTYVAKDGCHNLDSGKIIKLQFESLSEGK